VSALTRLRLAADGRSPGLARRHVRGVLAAAGREDVLDEALLLVTELVTNAVVHAGTDVELDVEPGPDGVRAEVRDGGSGALPMPQGTVEESSEGGRGLFLLDLLASSWGTTHHAGGKAVWFVLAGSAPVLPPAAVDPSVVPVPADDLAWLVGLPDDLETRLPPALVVRELLSRLADGTGAASLSVLCDPADDSGAWEPYAALGQTQDADRREQVRLATTRSGARSLLRPGLVVLPLRAASELLGALVLDDTDDDGRPLGPTAVALARLVADRVASVLSDERGGEARRRARGSLALLAEASEMFAGSLDVTLAATLLTSLVVPRYARWAAVYTMLDESGPLLVSVAHSDEAEVAPLRVLLSGTGAAGLPVRLAAALEPGRPHLTPVHDLPGVLRAQAGGELLALPLVARRRLLGMLLVRRDDGAAYAGDEVSVLSDLARRAALAVANAHLYEESTAVARALQASLLPPALPVVPGLDFGARYQAAGAGNEVGGDFYDVFPLDAGGWAVAVGDVCGKGAEAAAITGLARSVLRLLTEQGRPARAVFGRLNRAILELGDRGRFCTTALATFVPEPGGLRVCLATAGHPAPALVRADGTVELVGTGGSLLGVMPDLDVAEDVLHLAHGEQLVFYTDGVTERRDGTRWFGDEGLQAALSKVAGRPADRVAGYLAERVRGFSRTPASDDLAVLVVRAVPLPDVVPQPGDDRPEDRPRGAALPDCTPVSN
jgi:phosphoserine phosphatase RsbU/P